MIRETLFSAIGGATAAYRAIAFQQFGLWTLLLLQEKRGIHG